MPLVDSSRSIGALTRLMQGRLQALTGHSVTVGRPEPPSGAGDGNSRLNLFLYEAMHDGHMSEVALDENQEPPMWLVLRYIVTSFDETGESDTIAAHRILGDGLRALRSVAHLPLVGLGADDTAALRDNPERLKITFRETSTDLLSKLMQGTDEKYRFSMAFEVRPVMIAGEEPPSYALLVGVDYETADPQKRIIGEEGIRLEVEPTMGAVIRSVLPSEFPPGDQAVDVEGEDLHLSGLRVRLGGVELPSTPVDASRLTFTPTSARLTGDVISAGSHPLALIRTLPSGRERSSNLFVVGLLPELEQVTRTSPTVILATGGHPELITATINLSGRLLGSDTDDVFVALYRDGRVVAALDDVKDQAGNPPAQTKKRVKIEPPIPTGEYRVILRVNGMQARQSPTLDLTAP